MGHSSDHSFIDWVWTDKYESAQFLKRHFIFDGPLTWGYVVVRTSKYGTEWDHIWSKAPENLRGFIELAIAYERFIDLEAGGNGQVGPAETMIKDKLSLVCLENSILERASGSEIRQHVISLEKDVGNKDLQRLRRPDACLVMDQRAMETLAEFQPPESESRIVHDAFWLQTYPTVRVVDLDRTVEEWARPVGYHESSY